MRSTGWSTSKRNKLLVKTGILILLLRFPHLPVDAKGAMKSFLIMCLATALAAAAFYTRPGQRELVFHLIDTQAAKSDRSWRKSDAEKADKLARSITIRDRLLWVEAEKDGQVLYTGAFAHWFENTPKDQKGDKSEKSERATVAQVAKLIGNF
jgi:hypothetical protein